MKGRLLTSTSTEFLVGCRLRDLAQLPFGALVKVPWLKDASIPGELYGLVAWVRIPESSMARQVAVQERPTPGVMDDQQATSEPAEVRVLVVGYRQGATPSHLLPPYPPRPLAELHLCPPEEVVEFTRSGRLGYLRHILRATDLPMPELLAAHLRQAHEAHAAQGNPHWVHGAVQRVIHLLRDDPPTLMWVLDALSDALPVVLSTWEEALS